MEIDSDSKKMVSEVEKANLALHAAITAQVDDFVHHQQPLKLMQVSETDAVTVKSRGACWNSKLHIWEVGNVNTALLCRRWLHPSVVNELVHLVHVEYMEKKALRLEGKEEVIRISKPLPTNFFHSYLD